MPYTFHRRRMQARQRSLELATRTLHHVTTMESSDSACVCLPSWPLCRNSLTFVATQNAPGLCPAFRAFWTCECCIGTLVTFPSPSENSTLICVKSILVTRTHRLPVSSSSLMTCWPPCCMKQISFAQWLPLQRSYQMKTSHASLADTPEITLIHGPRKNALR